MFLYDLVCANDSSRQHSKLFVLDPDAGTIEFDIPKDTANGILINNNKVYYVYDTHQ